MVRGAVLVEGLHPAVQNEVRRQLTTCNARPEQPRGVRHQDGPDSLVRNFGLEGIAGNVHGGCIVARSGRKRKYREILSKIGYEILPQPPRLESFLMFCCCVPFWRSYPYYETSRHREKGRSFGRGWRGIHRPALDL